MFDQGRSSSRSLNLELEGVYPQCSLLIPTLNAFFSTLINRADDPTRGKEIRPPGREWPSWWTDVCNGNFEEFDSWLASFRLDDYSVSGLPPLEELCPCKLVDAPYQPPPKVDRTLSNPCAPSESVLEKNGSRSECSQARSCKGSRLPAERVDALRAFPRNQFVMPADADWPPSTVGFLDLFAGERVAKALAARGFWSLCFDICYSPNEDLMDPNLQNLLEALLASGCFCGVGGGPVCTSFSTAITPPIRNACLSTPR